MNAVFGTLIFLVVISCTFQVKACLQSNGYSRSSNETKFKQPSSADCAVLGNFPFEMEINNNHKQQKQSTGTSTFSLKTKAKVCSEKISEENHGVHGNFPFHFDESETK